MEDKRFGEDIEKWRRTWPGRYHLDMERRQKSVGLLARISFDILGYSLVL